ncbi:MAG: hypothetical protein IJA87_05310 [Clostridia bacterium]|nr:hypothetical protein [Clostridia bacterium]
MALINCPVCGKQVSDRGTDCIHCGSSLIVKFAECPECGNRQAEENERCEICGCPLNVKYVSCPECGNEMPEDAIRCENCGCPIEECVPIQVTEATPQAPWQPEMTYMPAEATADDATVIDKQAVRKKIKKYRILSDICLCLGSAALMDLVMRLLYNSYLPFGIVRIFELLFGVIIYN